ncbi:glucose/galactose transporter [Pelomonas saccharophila]|uniref:Glucose/galactose transporter n=1 Tax=Roseateles saccharophilus TaxID=304 RepID=A0ABU1YTY8_ROSSA|nr:sugar MFS transporter [Roseateles saccharophilus]MDR7271670.1 glucose/galactose transporter [Roseateles saccharophilus]
MHTKTLTPTAGQGVLLPMLFIGLMFFILGFVTWLNGSLIPFLKIVCELNNFQALWVAFAFYIAYTVMALPSAAMLARIGYKNGMTAGLGVMALGALCFIPAAKSGLYPVFLLALFTLASGMTLMQTAINPYIVCIGPRESAAMRISIMGLFNKGAGIVVPLVFTALILSGMERFSESALAALDAAGREALRNELSQRLVFPYAVMAAGLVAFMALIHFSSLREPELEAADAPSGEVKRWGVFQHPQVVLGAIALFGYVGVEVIAGDTIGLYGRQLGVAHYGVLTSYTMGFMVLGYLLGVALIPRWMSQRAALVFSAVSGIAFVLGVALSSSTESGISQALLGWVGVPAVPNTVFFLALLGLSNALVWPSIWPLALEGLGKYTAAGSALLIMGIAGGALIPMLYGHFADVWTPQSGYWVMLPWYALILFYALFGSRLRRW